MNETTIPERRAAIECNLYYHGKQLAPEPFNLTLDDTARFLRRGEPVMVQLEPGDGTHYGLLIVPAWSSGVAPHLGRYGIRPFTAKDYLIVTYLNDRGGDSFFAFADGLEAWDMEGVKNLWTREVFVWWFRTLWQALNSLVP